MILFKLDEKGKWVENYVSDYLRIDTFGVTGIHSFVIKTNKNGDLDIRVPDGRISVMPVAGNVINIREEKY